MTEYYKTKIELVEEKRKLKRVIDTYMDMLVEYTGKSEGDLIGEMHDRVIKKEK